MELTFFFAKHFSFHIFKKKKKSTYHVNLEAPPVSSEQYAMKTCKCNYNTTADKIKQIHFQ